MSIRWDPPPFCDVRGFIFTIRKGNRSTLPDGLCHLVISRHAPPSCATAPLPTVHSVEGGNPRVSFPSVSRPCSLSEPSAPWWVSLEAGGGSSSRPDQIQDHRPGLAKQDKYFQIGLGVGEGPGQGPHRHRARSGNICLAWQDPVDDPGSDPDDCCFHPLPRGTPTRVLKAPKDCRVD